MYYEHGKLCKATNQPPLPPPPPPPPSPFLSQNEMFTQGSFHYMKWKGLDTVRDYFDLSSPKKDMLGYCICQCSQVNQYMARTTLYKLGMTQTLGATSTTALITSTTIGGWTWLSLWVWAEGLTKQMQCSNCFRDPQLIFNHFHFLLSCPDYMAGFLSIIHSQVSEECEMIEVSGW